jgi:hypothetical protein
MQAHCESLLERLRGKLNVLTTLTQTRQYRASIILWRIADPDIEESRVGMYNVRGDTLRELAAYCDDVEVRWA